MDARTGGWTRWGLPCSNKRGTQTAFDRPVSLQGECSERCSGEEHTDTATDWSYRSRDLGSSLLWQITCTATIWMFESCGGVYSRSLCNDREMDEYTRSFLGNGSVNTFPLLSSCNSWTTRMKNVFYVVRAEILWAGQFEATSSSAPLEIFQSAHRFAICTRLSAFRMHTII
jgi:hypothetical protein